MNDAYIPNKHYFRVMLKRINKDWDHTHTYPSNSVIFVYRVYVAVAHLITSEKLFFIKIMQNISNVENIFMKVWPSPVINN